MEHRRTVLDAATCEDKKHVHWRYPFFFLDKICQIHGAYTLFDVKHLPWPISHNHTHLRKWQKVHCEIWKNVIHFNKELWIDSKTELALHPQQEICTFKLQTPKWYNTRNTAWIDLHFPITFVSDGRIPNSKIWDKAHLTMVRNKIKITIIAHACSCTIKITWLKLLISL